MESLGTTGVNMGMAGLETAGCVFPWRLLALVVLAGAVMYTGVAWC